MDVVQDWAAYLLQSNVQLASYIVPYAGQLIYFSSTLKSWLLPILDQVTRKPDLATVALLLIIILVSLKILNMLYQAVLFWVRLAKRIVFWGGLGVLALWMYSRGPDGMVEDVQYWVEVWSTDYQYFKEKETTARIARQKPTYGRFGAAGK